MTIGVISKAEGRRGKNGSFRPARAEIVLFKGDGKPVTLHLRKRGDKWVDKAGQEYDI